MLKRYCQLPKGKSGNKNTNENELKKNHLCKTRSMKGALAALARAQMGTTQTQLCFILGI